MLETSLIAQCLFLLAAIAVSAKVTLRSRSILKGGLCLYGLFILYAVLFCVVVRLLLVAIGVESHEVVHAFPEEIGVLPVIMTSWIPAFIVISLVHLAHTAYTRTLDASGLWGSRHWLVRLARRLRLLPDDASAHPGKRATYPKWVGVILGFLLTGSAHFLSGRRRAGVAWYLSWLAMGVLATCLIAIPGTASCLAGGLVMIATLTLWLTMLRRSYRAVRRIGMLGWLAVIAINLSLQEVERWSARFMIEAFRISSQSMSPTLEGVHGRDMTDGETIRPGLIAGLVRGERYMQWRASGSGPLNGPYYLTGESAGFDGYSVGKDSQRLPRGVTPRFRNGQRVDRGTLVWSGFVVAPDRVIVEKVSYLFRNPGRGEIVVFKTQDSGRREGREYHTFRVAGFPGERIRIDPPWLVVNGERVVDPPIFAAIGAKEQGFAGFSQPRPGDKSVFDSSGEVLLRDDEYFVLGDGKDAYDSRYRGPVLKKDIVGRITRIYWPLNRVNALDGKW